MNLTPSLGELFYDFTVSDQDFFVLWLIHRALSAQFQGESHGPNHVCSDC
jgi:hypothetical protein